MHGPDGKPSPPSRRVDTALATLRSWSGVYRTRAVVAALVAAYCGVTAATVEGWADGSVPLPARGLGRLADALGVPLAWLAYGGWSNVRLSRPAALGGRAKG